MDATDSQIAAFLSAPAFAVAGASNNPSKYGHRVLACYIASRRKVYPVNPSLTSVLGLACYASVKDLPEPVASLSIVTAPAVTRRVIGEAVEAGVRNIWCQPGAEDWQAIEDARAAGVNVIAGGPCILVVMSYHQ